MLAHHPGRCGEKNGLKEQDFAGLLDAADQQLGGKIVLVWDNSTRHKDAPTREILADQERLLTVFWLPAYAPELNPTEGVWANRNNYLGNLAACTLEALADLAAEEDADRPDLLDGFIAETGLTWTPP